MSHFEVFYTLDGKTYRPNTENGSGAALRGCERIVEVYDYCRRRKWNT
nr:MAG TPA: hypothetical protein [Caudoviricetes sp.]